MKNTTHHRAGRKSKKHFAANKKSNNNKNPSSIKHNNDTTLVQEQQRRRACFKYVATTSTQRIIANDSTNYLKLRCDLNKQLVECATAYLTKQRAPLCPTFDVIAVGDLGNEPYVIASTIADDDGRSLDLMEIVFGWSPKQGWRIKLEHHVRFHHTAGPIVIKTANAITEQILPLISFAVNWPKLMFLYRLQTASQHNENCQWVSNSLVMSTHMPIVVADPQNSDRHCRFRCPGCCQESESIAFERK